MQSGEDAGPSKAVAGVDNTSRRQFDLEQFRAQAAKRELEEEELDGLTPYEVKQLKRRSMRLPSLLERAYLLLTGSVIPTGCRLQEEIHCIRVLSSSAITFRVETIS